jgi:Protein of unknown function (DUF2510)
VSDEDYFSAPAGWYPDPLGLPQLRWWNNHGWTEQVSSARPPVIMHGTTLAWADDDEPAAEKPQEKRATPEPARPTAETLHQLNPPGSTAASSPLIDPYSPLPRPSIDPRDLKFWSAPRPEDVRRLAAERAETAQ